MSPQGEQIVRPEFRRTDDREQPPVVAPAPARVVTGGYASAGLLAWIALSNGARSAEMATARSAA